jgi:sortase A
METPRQLAPERTGAFLWLERALWVVGLLGLGWFLAVQLETRLFQARAEAGLERSLAATRTAAASLAPRAADRPAELPGEGPAAAGEAAGTGASAVPPGTVLGRRELPRLGLATIVAGGIDRRTLRRAVGHIPGTALPGEPGNVGLAGHRDRFFRDLHDVEPDDEIVLTTPDGVFHYRVEWTEVVEPTDVEVLDDGDTPSLTLVTCFPFYYVGPAPQRFIVRARQVRQELVQANSSSTR